MKPQEPVDRILVKSLSTVLVMPIEGWYRQILIIKAIMYGDRITKPTVISNKEFSRVVYE